MAELKTKPGKESVEAFLNSLTDQQKKADSFRISEIMQQITGTPPVMWGSNIIGFGEYHYKYESGREGDWFLTGFSPRKDSLSLYIMSGFSHYDELMTRLGKYKTGKACLYVKKLQDINETVLRQLITESVSYMREKHT